MRAAVSQLRVLFTLFITTLAIGCGASPTVETPAYPSPPVDPALVKMVDQLGDGAPLVVVLDLRELTRFRDFFEGHRTHFGPLGEVIGTHLADPKASLRGLAQQAGAPTVMDSMDLERPVIAGLFEAMVDGSPGIGARLSPIGDVPIPGLRHEVLLPAKNAAELLKALEGILDRAATREGDRWVKAGTMVSLRAEGDVVRVLVVSNRLLPPSTDDKAVPIWPTKRAAPARTPALARLTSGGVPLAAHLRPWRIRGTATMMGIYQTIEALRLAPPEMQQVMSAMGLQLVLSGEALMLAAKPEYDDHTLTLLPSARGITVDFISSLTPAGRDIMRAASESAVFYPLTKEVTLDASVGVDLGRALTTAGPRAELSAHGTAPEIGAAVQSCGPGCLWHLFTRVPWGTVATIAEQQKARAKLLHIFPHAAQMALLPSATGKPEAMAVVATVPATFAIEALPPLVKLRASSEVSLVTVGDRKVLTIGRGVDPQTVFDLERPIAGGQLASLEFTEAFTEQLPLAQMPQAKALEGALAGVRFDARLARDGRSVSMRLDIASKPGAPPTVTESTGLQWTSPILGYQKSPGDACILAAFTEARMAFQAIGSAAPDQRRALFESALTAMQPHLDCAAKHPATAAAAAGLAAQLKATAKKAEPTPPADAGKASPPATSP